MQVYADVLFMFSTLRVIQLHNRNARLYPEGYNKIEYINIFFAMVKYLCLSVAISFKGIYF